MEVVERFAQPVSLIVFGHWANLCRSTGRVERAKKGPLRSDPMKVLGEDA
jgi:hypothetical protein